MLARQLSPTARGRLDRLMSHPAEPFRVGFLYEGLFRAMATNVIAWSVSSFDRSGCGSTKRRPRKRSTGRSSSPSRQGKGLPYGTAKAVEDAWLELAGCGRLGNHRPRDHRQLHRDPPPVRHAGIPTINFPGTRKTRGEYGFHCQIGSLYDGGPLVARAIAAETPTTVAMIRDRSVIGDEFFRHFGVEIGEERLTSLPGRLSAAASVRAPACRRTVTAQRRRRAKPRRWLSVTAAPAGGGGAGSADGGPGTRRWRRCAITASRG